MQTSQQKTFSLFHILSKLPLFLSLVKFSTNFCQFFWIKVTPPKVILKGGVYWQLPGRVTVRMTAACYYLHVSWSCWWLRVTWRTSFNCAGDCYYCRLIHWSSISLRGGHNKGHTMLSWRRGLGYTVLSLGVRRGTLLTRSWWTSRCCWYSRWCGSFHRRNVTFGPRYLPSEETNGNNRDNCQNKDQTAKDNRCP